MPFPAHKTKIVCTIGPASDSQDVIEEMIRTGMDVARINFSHGEFEHHREVIRRVRAAARSTGQRVAVMADLPGPKIRIGNLVAEPVELTPGDMITLTTQEVPGNAQRVSVSFPRLPDVVRQGDALFLNDGFIQLAVLRTDGPEILCRVEVGGELRSRKGLNLPGIDLGIGAFTDRDRECLKVAIEAGVEAISQSFVECAEDIVALRQAARDMEYDPFVIAKIERARALDRIDDILEHADGVMIARGDLGVEVPIEQIAVVQKRLMRKANLLGKPVITATQMLESMTTNRRPTRAESTDVANAILDGTDCVMLSEESAMGRYPVDAVAMLAKIAAVVEPYVSGHVVRQEVLASRGHDEFALRDLIALSVVATVDRAIPAAVFVPTRTGATARSITRFRLPTRIVAVSSHEATCSRLQFSFGVHPVLEPDHPEDWSTYACDWLTSHEVAGKLVVLTEGPSSKHPEANHCMEIIDLSRSAQGEGQT